MSPAPVQSRQRTHARPFAALQPPERISHLALRRDEQSAAEDHAFIVKFCEQGTDRTCSAAYQYFGIIFRHLAERRMSNRRRSNKFLKNTCNKYRFVSVSLYAGFDLPNRGVIITRFELIIHNFKGIFLSNGLTPLDHGRHPPPWWRRIGLCGRRATGRWLRGSKREVLPSGARANRIQAMRTVDVLWGTASRDNTECISGRRRRCPSPAPGSTASGLREQPACVWSRGATGRRLGTASGRSVVVPPRRGELYTCVTSGDSGSRRSRPCTHGLGRRLAQTADTVQKVPPRAEAVPHPLRP